MNMVLVLIHLQSGFMTVVMESANSSSMEDVKEIKTGSHHEKNVNKIVVMYKVRNYYFLVKHHILYVSDQSNLLCQVFSSFLL